MLSALRAQKTDLQKGQSNLKENMSIKVQIENVIHEHTSIRIQTELHIRQRSLNYKKNSSKIKIFLCANETAENYNDSSYSEEF